MKKPFFMALLLAAVLTPHGPVKAQPVTKITIQANKPICEVNPAMWGIFFEDINFAADGGLYAELVKNRSFEFLKPMMGWKETRQGNASGKILIENRNDENSNNPRFARVSANAETGAYGLTNEGFRGMGITKDKSYNFSVMVRTFGEGNVKIRVELVNSNGEKIGEASLSGFTDKWAKYTASFKSSGTDAKARLNILLEGKGTLDLDMISLFPQDTWKNRPNGLRSDLVQLLADLKPGFIRFPGGCIVEGHELATRYQWKKTVGNIEDRKLIINRWNTEFPAHSTPDYFQSYGLGFFEYFQLSEDIGAEPLPIINCGMACQYNTGEVAQLSELDPYVQDALDLIEFANGTTSTKWGKLRAEMGHPAPFNLKMLGVGNEQWDEQYIERLKIFQKAIKDKYPDIKLITSAGPSPDGKQFNYLWPELKKLNTDFVDEHYYKSPDWFLKNAQRYDNYDRKGPKVFAGEYASHSTKANKNDKNGEVMNNWDAALSEAAFMTGLERNAEVVNMASYAPLFAHEEAWQWRPNLIWFDNLRSIATPNYYVQKLFANNKGTNVVPVLLNNEILAGKDSLYASANIDKKTNEVIVKLINVSAKPQPFEIIIEGASVAKKSVYCQTLSSDKLTNFNTLDNPKTIVPIEKNLPFKSNRLSVKVEGSSINLFRIPCKKL
ncbi:MAG: alpha-L-arabinofuranosidase C-terminal domain-containing protein [Bacteroidota bacterium]|nr:alpha-L-arabinofuranosidase C-terminal domain-containing protein [Bacteroidota bacterium]